MINSFTAMARVVSEPETKTFGTKEITKVRMVNSVSRKKNGSWVECPFFFNAVFFSAPDRLKELHKGNLVAVTGELVCDTVGDNGKMYFNLNVNKFDAISSDKKAESKSDDDIDFDVDDMPV